MKISDLNAQICAIYNRIRLTTVQFYGTNQ